MNIYQRDLGFLLLIKYGTSPFTYQEITKAKEETLARERLALSSPEVEWLAMSKRLAADKLIEDNVIEFLSFSLTEKMQVYKLTDEYIKELQNEK